MILYIVRVPPLLSWKSSFMYYISFYYAYSLFCFSASGQLLKIILCKPAIVTWCENLIPTVVMIETYIYNEGPVPISFYLKYRTDGSLVC